VKTPPVTHVLTALTLLGLTSSHPSFPKNESIAVPSGEAYRHGIDILGPPPE
jgi:hypothetical protein